jgi:hypothetical protein
MHLLPNYARAVIEDSKLVRDALNSENERGQHKARVFASALGFDMSNWEQSQQGNHLSEDLVKPISNPPSRVVEHGEPLCYPSL